MAGKIAKKLVRSHLMNKPVKQLVLNKSGEKFIFRYEQGNENELLNAFVDQANDVRTNFDWFDAAVLSFKLTHQLIGQADSLLHQNKTGPGISAG